MPFDFSADTRKNYLQTINQNAPDAGAALKVLALNLPNFVGGSPILPDALLKPGLSTNAQVGGTPQPISTQPVGPRAPDAGPGGPDQPGPVNPTPQSAPIGSNSLSPFTSAPIASLAANALTPTTAPPPAPTFVVDQPTRDQPVPDVIGGQPNAPAAPNPLADLLRNLIGNGGDRDRGRI